MVEAVRSLDTEAYFSLFDQDNFTAQFGGKTLGSFAEFRVIYESYFPEVESYLSLEFPVVRVHVLTESAAVLINEYSEVVLTVSGDTLRSSGSGTQVWKRSELGWKLVHVAGS